MLLSWPTAIQLAFAACCVPLAAGQSFLSDPLQFWEHESGYAGASACMPCHAAIFEAQSSSNHARSLRPIGEVGQFAKGLPVTRDDRASGSELTLDQGPPGDILLQARFGAQTAVATLGWAFGSGVKGITPIGHFADGGWFESRLTWYESLHDIAFTTGASKYDPGNAREALGRELSRQQVAECFGCHTTAYDAERAEPARGEMGIHCERCHGPGQDHAELAAQGMPPKSAIFNPGRLDGFAQAQMCGACHGKPPEYNDFDALRLLEETPHSVRFPSQRLVLSRCFNETFGELACTSCHDPHGDVSDEAERLEQACISCHSPEARTRGATCPVAEADCSACHMPKERVMRHSLFGDHWIRVVRED